MGDQEEVGHKRARWCGARGRTSRRRVMVMRPGLPGLASGWAMMRFVWMGVDDSTSSEMKTLQKESMPVNG